MLPLLQVMVLGQRICNNDDDMTKVIIMTAMMVDRSPGDGHQRIASGEV